MIYVATTQYIVIEINKCRRRVNKNAIDLLSLVSFEIPKQVRNDTLSFVMLNLVLNLIQYRFSISFNAFVLISIRENGGLWRMGVLRNAKSKGL